MSAEGSTAIRVPAGLVVAGFSALVGLFPRASAAQASAQEQSSAPPPTAAEADDAKLECLKHYEDAQIARRTGRLLATRAELLLCSLASCPAVIRADCVDWIEQVNRSLPSVVVTARARGRDVASVKVFIDDTLVAERLSGAAFDVDPGEHRFRFESSPWLAVERTVLVSEGVKGRAIEVEFDDSAPPVPEAARPAAPPAPPPSGHRLRALDYALGGVALAGLGTFAVAGSWALFERHDLKQRCAPFCSDDEVQSVATKLMVADVALGVAVVSLAVLYVHVSWSPTSRGTVAIRESEFSMAAQATRQGATVAVRGAF